MGGGAETVKTKRLAVLDTSQSQAAVSDGTCAQQRGRLGIGKGVRNRVGEVLAHHGVLGIAARRIAAGGLEVRAQVLLILLAELAAAACRMDPGDSHAVALLESAGSASSPHHSSHNLVSQYHGEPLRRRPPLDLIEVRMAEAADSDLDQDLSLTGFGFRQIHKSQRFPVLAQVDCLLQNHCFHNILSSSDLPFVQDSCSLLKLSHSR